MSHADPRPLSLTRRHVPSPYEFSEPSIITPTPFSHLLPPILGSPLSSFDLHVGFSKSVSASLTRHGEAAVYTWQRGHFDLDCEMGSYDPLLDASEKHLPSHSPFSGWHRPWDAEPGNLGLVVNEAAGYHYLRATRTAVLNW